MEKERGIRILTSVDPFSRIDKDTFYDIWMGIEKEPTKPRSSIPVFWGEKFTKAFDEAMVDYASEKNIVYGAGIVEQATNKDWRTEMTHDPVVSINSKWLERKYDNYKSKEDIRRECLVNVLNGYPHFKCVTPNIKN